MQKLFTKNLLVARQDFSAGDGWPVTGDGGILKVETKTEKKKKNCIISTFMY